LLDNITKEEFKGNLIIILAGYEADIDQLFTVNVGLSSRFDKTRIRFPAWLPEDACAATIESIEKEGKSMKEDAICVLLSYYQQLSTLPAWASARDVYESILPSLYSVRAERLLLLQQSMDEYLSVVECNVDYPYTIEDVHLACQPLCEVRQKISKQLGNRSDFSISNADLLRKQAGGFETSSTAATGSTSAGNDRMDTDSSNGNGNGNGNSNGVGKSEKKRKRDDFENETTSSITQPNKDVYIAMDDDDDDHNDGGRGNSNNDNNNNNQRNNEKVEQKLKYKALPPPDMDTIDGEDDEDDGLGNLIALLEEACAELGYTIEQMEKFLASGKLPKELVSLVWQKNGGAGNKKVNLSMIHTALKKQVGPLLLKVRAIIKQMEEEKNAEELKKQEKLKHMGLCVMGFVWLKQPGGYRCAGGSHYISDVEIDQYCL
jgi:hypothetical protein